MSLTRRSFVQTLGVGSAGILALGARGREDMVALAQRGESSPDLAGLRDLILSSNENPLGPPPSVIEAVRVALSDGRKSGRYMFSRTGSMAEAIAKRYGVKADEVYVGCGSTQILRAATQLFTSPTRPLVGSIPTYEECAGYAALIGSPVTGVKLDAALKLDLDATLKAAKGAGLVFYCNPNNPTATVHPGRATNAFLDALRKSSPDTAVLVDEAYQDYVSDANRSTQVPRAVSDPNVIVARTFSKAYGMAGIRLGFAIAHVDTIKKIRTWEGFGDIPWGLPALEAGLAAVQLDDAFIARERARNTEAREFTRKFFVSEKLTTTDSETNFIFVNLRRPIEEFQKACRAKGVRVGRPFPPLTTYARISIGTLEEMKRATPVFASALRTVRRTA